MLHFKKYSLFFLTMFLSLLATHSQAQTITTINLNTGTGAVGATDPNWSVQIPLPAPPGFTPLTISSGIPTTGNIATYAQDPCGQWISPFVQAAPPFNILGWPDIAGDYTYRMPFDIDECTITSAILDIPFMAADNSIEGIRVNGTLYAVPPGIDHTMPGLMTIPITVTNGSNTIDIIVNNLGSFTALQLCGIITVTQEDCCALPPPSPVNCNLTVTDQILSWSPVPGAAGYQLEINYNDPHCCSVTGPLLSQIVMTTGTSHTVPGETTCFSWRIKTICTNGKKGEFGSKTCFCGNEPPCELPVPSNLNCTLSEIGQTLTWDPVVGASNYDIIISYNDAACCHNGKLPYSSMLSSATNSIVIPSLTECFSWRVRARCPNNSKTEFSAPSCGCGDENACNLPSPINLSCAIIGNDQVLTWDPVPLAISYEIVINYNDPLCCTNGQLPYSVLMTTTDPFWIHPGVEECFSWQVRAICLDGTVSAFSDRSCSCHNPNPCSLDAPTGLDCHVHLNERILSWTSLAGALSYEIQVTYNDPTCCPGSGFPSMFIFTSTDPFITVSLGLPECYAWKVRGICSDGSISPWSTIECVCPVVGAKSNSSNVSSLLDAQSTDLTVQVMPNPAQDQVSFSLSNKGLDTEEQGVLYIKTIDGKTVYQTNIDLNSTTQINLSSFENGYYMYQIVHPQVTKSGKLVIQK